MSFIDEIKKLLAGQKPEQQSLMWAQILADKELYDSMRKAGLDVSVTETSERGLQRPYGAMSKVFKVDLVDLITEITRIKNITDINSIQWLNEIGKIDLITKLSQLDVVDVINSIKNIDKIGAITEISSIAAFGEVGTWLPFSKTVTGDVLTPTTGYRLKILSGHYICRDDIYTELRFKTSGNLVLGLPTLGSIGMNPLSQTKPLGATNELLELYMSATGYAKGWIVYQQVAGTGTAHSKTVSEILGLGDSVATEYVAGGGGAWVTPTGYNDPDSGWNQEGLTYDDFEFTYGDGNPVEQDTWTSFLYWTHAAITSNKLRYMVSSRSDRFDIDVDVYKDGVWVDVYQGATSNDGTWIEKTFSQGQVTQMRIRFYDKSGVHYHPWIYEVDFWQVI